MAYVGRGLKGIVAPVRKPSLSRLQELGLGNWIDFRKTFRAETSRWQTLRAYGDPPECRLDGMKL